MFWQIFFIVLLALALWCAWRISVADLRRRIIPDAYLWPLLLIGALIVTWSPFWPIGPYTATVGAAFGYALAAIVGFVFDWICRRKNPDADTPIVMGDIKSESFQINRGAVLEGYISQCYSDNSPKKFFGDK